MKQIPCFLKRLVPVCILILHSTLAFSDLPPGDLILSDVEIVQVVLEPRGLIAEKPASFKLTIDSTFTVKNMSPSVPTIIRGTHI